ncbi:MAG: glycoside hydrolase family 28 protein [Prevotella sp.]|nr:glycoside hydrolase family 28 protein [Prevotella sp.]
MRKILLAAIFVVSVVSSYAQQQWDSLYADILANIQEPQFAERVYLITKYGASQKDNGRKNQKAIQKAIDRCSADGGGKVVVPAGLWLTGALTLKDNVCICLEEGATLRFAFDTSLYPNVMTRWEGVDCINYQPLIYASHSRNIGIKGKGVIDGNGSKETWWGMTGYDWWGWHDGMENARQGSRDRLLKMAEDGVPAEQRVFGSGEGLRPQLINFYQCEGIILEDVKVIDSPFWVIHPLLSKNIILRNVTVWNEGPNGDGCDPESCEYILIEGCRFHTGDDCIAIKAGRNADGRRWARPTQNMIVRNCEMEDGHGAVVVGSEVSGGCRNVLVENCRMDSPKLDRVIRIKTNSCRGGVIENIFVRDCTVGQCKESVLKVNLDYDPKEQCCRGYKPVVMNVWMQNVTCNKSKYGVMVVGFTDTENVSDITLRDCKFNVSDENIKVTGKMGNLSLDNVSFK